MTTDSDRLLAAGVPITLTDGRVLDLRFGMRALKCIEDAFGSIDAIDDAFEQRQIGPLVSILAAGLGHHGISEDALLDLLDPLELGTYADAMRRAFEIAFPKPPEAEVGNALSPGGFPGLSSTTSPPSVTAAPMVSSGR